MTAGAGPLLSCLLAAALFGASSPAAKALLTSTPPLLLAGLLYLGAALGTLPFALRGGSRAARRRPANVLRMGGVVLFGGVLGPCLLLLGLARAPAASVSLWLNLETVATALLGWAFFREHLDRRALIGVVLVTVASVLLAGETGFALVPGALLVAAACACWGLDNNLQSLVDGFTPAQSTCIKGAVAGAVNLALAHVVAQGALDFAAREVLLGLGLGALAYGASIVLYVRGAQQLGATRAQMVFATAPFVGVAVAWAVLREPVLPLQLVAAALMGAALVVVHRARHVHAHVHVPTTHTHWHRHDDGHHDHDHAQPPRGGHVHEHAHDAREHAHAHSSDLHHRHGH